MQPPPDWTARGWSDDGWAARLRQMADRCEAYHPERAAELRREADVCDGKGSPENMHSARMQPPERGRKMPGTHKGRKRVRKAEAQCGGEGLLFGSMEEVEDDGT